ALAFPADEAAVWRRALPALFGPAAGPWWPRERRLIYDLQKVCIDRERDVYAVDLVEWARSFGRRPVQRLLPHQKQVNLVRHLREALARNRLKLPDLSGPGEFLLGDPLIRANRQLAVSLDGVYRRGEIYLRLLQRLSALAFGTAVGRFLTLYLILPFGGAF